MHFPSFPVVRWITSAVLIVANGALPATSEQARKGLAVLIGNDRYAQNQVLKTPRKNALGLQKALQAMGFEVEMKSNLELREMKKLLDEELPKKLQPTDVLFLYFAGHGVADGSLQYILPVDVPPNRFDAWKGELKRQELDTLSIATAAAKSKAYLVFIVIEACGNRPQASTPTKSGPAEAVDANWVPEPDRTAVIFAANAGQQASDEADSNGRSAFANSLITSLEQTCIDQSEALALPEQLLAAYGKPDRGVPFDRVKRKFSFWCPASLSGIQLTENVRINQKDRLGYTFVREGSTSAGCAKTDPICERKVEDPTTIKFQTGFWIGQTEVTVRAFHEVMKPPIPLPRPPAFNPDWLLPSLPMTNVTWAEADEYCRKTGGRLPTESEWEYVGRRQYDGTEVVYAWEENDTTDPRHYANYGSDSFRGFAEGDDRWRDTPAPVAWFPPLPLNPIFDLTGNVWEWVSTPYSPVEEPFQIVRGGSWRSPLRELKLSSRLRVVATARDDSIGFRCVMPASTFQ